MPRTSDRQRHLQLIEQQAREQAATPPGWRWVRDEDGHVRIVTVPRPIRIPTKPTLRERLRRVLVDLYAYLTGPAAW